MVIKEQSKIFGCVFITNDPSINSSWVGAEPGWEAWRVAGDQLRGGGDAAPDRIQPRRSVHRHQAASATQNQGWRWQIRSAQTGRGSKF